MTEIRRDFLKDWQERIDKVSGGSSLAQVNKNKDQPADVPSNIETKNINCD